MKKLHVSVIGSSKATPEEYQFAYLLGKELAKRDLIVVCGGKEGVMEAVCKGAKEEKGITVGIVPSYDGKDANAYVDILIRTGMSHNRNPIVVASGDIVIAIGGSYGTLSEIAYAMILQKPVLGYKTHKVEGIRECESLEDLLAQLDKLLKD